MSREFAIAGSSSVGSFVGLMAPFAAVTLARLSTGRADGIFEYGLFFGGPLAGAVIGAVAGARLGRSLPHGATAGGCWRLVGWAAVAGLGWALARNAVLGVALWALMTGSRG
jgi:hypothetical protein